jgi:hypothetical protein
MGDGGGGMKIAGFRLAIFRYLFVEAADTLVNEE